MIAIGRNTDIHTASYRLITDGDLAACVQKNHIYLCEDQQTLRKDLAGSCLGALYSQSELGVHIHCRIEIRPLRETTYQISATRHIAYSPAQFSTQIQCTNGSHFPVTCTKTGPKNDPFFNCRRKTKELSKKELSNVAPASFY
jgi:hypothetical protein